MNSREGFDRIVSSLFKAFVTKDGTAQPFDRENILETAIQLDAHIPGRVSEVIERFQRGRRLPQSIRARNPEGKAWVIAGRGIGRYCFELRREALVRISADHARAVNIILDGTPSFIVSNLQSRKTALLATIRVNRIIDLLVNAVCYPVQNNVETIVPGVGRVITEEVYLARSERGEDYVIPLQVRAKEESIGIVQLENDRLACEIMFPDCRVRPVVAQFFEHEGLEGERLALMEFGDWYRQGTVKVREMQFKFIDKEEASEDLFFEYQRRVGRA